MPKAPLLYSCDFVCTCIKCKQESCVVKINTQVRNARISYFESDECMRDISCIGMVGHSAMRNNRVLYDHGLEWYHWSKGVIRKNGIEATHSKNNTFTVFGTLVWGQGTPQLIILKRTVFVAITYIAQMNALMTVATFKHVCACNHQLTGEIFWLICSFWAIPHAITHFAPLHTVETWTFEHCIAFKLFTILNMTSIWTWQQTPKLRNNKNANMRYMKATIAELGTLKQTKERTFSCAHLCKLLMCEIHTKPWLHDSRIKLLYLLEGFWSNCVVTLGISLVAWCCLNRKR